MSESNQEQMATATMAETLATVADVVLPNIAKGVIKRRPSVVGMAERLNLDQRAVERVARLRLKYGKGPLLLKVPFRNHAILLSPEDVEEVLQNSPEPFATATWEKVQALGHFQPYQALVSHGPDRADRRQFNEDALEPQAVCHHLGAQFAKVVAEEAEAILGRARENDNTLDWDVFAEGWFRVVRRIVLGDSAREDQELTEMLDSLRRNANWAFAHPRQKSLRKRFTERLVHYLDKGDQGSLAGAIKAMPGQVSPEHQIPQWLFAFDPAGMATFRTLALLATHPQQARKADEETASPDRAEAARLPFLRACVLESLRLWPTTPLILRESTRVTNWSSGSLPAGSNIIIFAPFFHRDTEHLPAANQFDPDLWLTDEPKVKVSWPVMPFSGGPAMCPGRQVVLLATSHMVAELRNNAELQLTEPGRLTSGEDLPATLDNYTLKFSVAPRP